MGNSTPTIDFYNENGYYRRCGITTDPKRRRREWQNDLLNVRDWEVVTNYNNRVDAQNWENGHDNTWGKSPGGRNPNNPTPTWYCYEFKHDGEQGSCTIL